MAIEVQDTPPSRVAELVRELDSAGFACLPDYLDREHLARMQRFVGAAMQKSGNEYISFGGPVEVAGSGLDELYHAPPFGRLLRSVYEQGTGRPAPQQEIYHVLRCLSGQSGQKHAWTFHYDSYVVTALIPIQIPTEGRAGDLLLFPNTRRIRPAYLLNAMDNRLTQRVLRASVERERLKPLRIRMQPGNLYFFWGYRTVHTNEPCDTDKVRATALFHFANPHRKAS